MTEFFTQLLFPFFGSVADLLFETRVEFFGGSFSIGSIFVVLIFFSAIVSFAVHLPRG